MHLQNTNKTRFFSLYLGTSTTPIATLANRVLSFLTF